VRLTVAPTGDRRLRPTGASGRVPATDHDLYHRHHRHVLHAHFTAGRPAPDRWLGQHPADIVLELDDAYELGRIATRCCTDLVRHAAR
jgi:hypothetical protein